MNKTDARRFAPVMQFGLICLVWLGVVSILQLANRASQRRVNQKASSPSVPGMGFVFADLDGDQKPDLAFVESQTRRSSLGNYSLRLRLSEGIESEIGVRAPFGGLHVAARDVNGDSSLDLVLTSDLDAAFVEVLLNDGHGNFSSTPAEDFFGTQNESALRLNVTGPRLASAALAVLPPPLEEALVKDRQDEQVLPSQIARPSSVRVALRRSPVSQSGRSPPVDFALC